MDLDPKQVNAFLAVIEMGNFEQASAKLHITPAAVSQRIRGLEDRLGRPLIVRSRPCRPTQAGQNLLQYTHRVMQLKDDLAQELENEKAQPSSIAIAINADTLATWFLPALSDNLIQQKILIELIIEDQEHTYNLMRDGVVAGCISTQSKPMRGCVGVPLGAMRYRLVASSSFYEKWFPDGFNRENARCAPVLSYTKKDSLHAAFLDRHLGILAGTYPNHYIPGAIPHFESIRHGLGYGMVPELLLKDTLVTNQIIDLAPHHPTDVDLFWHTWKIQSPRLGSFSDQLIESARFHLRQNPSPALMG